MGAGSLSAVLDLAKVMDYQEYFNRTAKQFNCKFTRSDLQARLRALADVKSENL
jgi:capsular polysaccharide biosynthesis protein